MDTSSAILLTYMEHFTSSGVALVYYQTYFLHVAVTDIFSFKNMLGDIIICQQLLSYVIPFCLRHKKNANFKENYAQATDTVRCL